MIQVNNCGTLFRFGLMLQLDYQNMTANVDRTYYHGPILYVSSQGNLQKQTNRNQLVGWGQQSYLSEFANAGNTVKDPSLNFLYDIQFPDQNISYRAFKNNWVGLPFNSPSIAVKLFCGVRLYMHHGMAQQKLWLGRCWPV
jgi:hypothetical protein